jgi:hypothetical protein
MSGIFSLHRQLGIHQFLLINGLFKCSTSTPVFTLIECKQYIDTYFHYRRFVSHLLNVYLNDRNQMKSHCA